MFEKSTVGIFQKDPLFKSRWRNNLVQFDAQYFDEHRSTKSKYSEKQNESEEQKENEGR
jgi:hypothetical protein